VLQKIKKKTRRGKGGQDADVVEESLRLSAVGNTSPGWYWAVQDRKAGTQLT
jgi:hypothetical protein